MMGVDEPWWRMGRVPARAARRQRVTRVPGHVAEAYKHCEAVTRARAGNFYYGIRLLPAPKRRAMCAVYAFARRVDDIGDGELAPEAKVRELDRQARALHGLVMSRPALAGDQALRPATPARDGASGEDRPAPGNDGDAVMVALADASARFSLPMDALGELIEGVRMDVAGVTYERFEDLVLYCRRVAGAIGRLCLAIFEVRPEHSFAAGHAQALADDLGVALQLTNILRDVREDAESGRVYVPAEDLRRFGLPSATGERAAGVLAALAGAAGAGGADGSRAAIAGEERDQGAEPGASGASGLAELVRFEAERARGWFDRGIALAALLDRRSAACVLAMAGIYERLLERIAADPLRAVARRTALPPWEKAWVAAGSMLGAEFRVRRRRTGAGEPIGGRG
jgi:phytoene synthase